MIYRTWHFSCGLKTNRGVPRGPHGPRNGTHQPYPLCQSITPKCPVNQPLCLLPRVDADFGHILSTFLDKNPQLESCVTNGLDKRRQSDGSETGSQRPLFYQWACLTYKSWSSTNPGDNPQIQNTDTKFPLHLQHHIYVSANDWLI